MGNQRTTRIDPDHPGLVLGWPRPLALTADNRRLPHAWVAELWLDMPGEPFQFPAKAQRGRQAIREWRCQVCGEQCGQIAYAPVAPGDCDSWPPMVAEGESIDVSAGAVCAIRCARLALAVCPHLTDKPNLVIAFERRHAFDNGDYNAVLTVWRWVIVERTAEAGGRTELVACPLDENFSTCGGSRHG